MEEVLKLQTFQSITKTLIQIMQISIIQDSLVLLGRTIMLKTLLLEMLPISLQSMLISLLWGY